MLLLLTMIKNIVHRCLLHCQHHHTRGLRQLRVHHGRRICRSGVHFFSGVARRLSVPLAVVSTPYRRVLTCHGTSPCILGCTRAVQRGISGLRSLVCVLRRFHNVHAKRGSRDRGVRLIPITRVTRDVIRAFNRCSRRGDVRYRLSVRHGLI